MAAVRNKNTGPEIALRKALHARGLRYRLNSPLAGRPDLVFQGARAAVFVDGDYWHGNAWRTRGFASFEAYYGRGSNAEFWLAKIRRNVRRDEDVTNKLTSQGWRVIRVWESDIDADADEAAAVVAASIRVEFATCAKRQVTP
jgi:DNA mismatch endonuclease, patch repair protein